MEKEEILTYFTEKAELTRPVYDLEEIINKEKTKINELKNDLKETAKYYLGGGAVCILLGCIFSILLFIGLIIIGFGIYKIYHEYKECNNLEDMCNVHLNQLNAYTSTTKYIEGARGFPRKFYDYISLSNLYQLVEENRATTVQEAYNLLETQIHNNNQEQLTKQNIYLSQKMNEHLEATETATTATATATTKTAYDTGKIAKNTAETASNTKKVAENTARTANNTDNIAYNQYNKNENKNFNNDRFRK